MRGIWVLNHDKSTVFQVIDVMPEAISFIIDKGGRKWFCTASYASPIPTIWVSLWEDLKQL